MGGCRVRIWIRAHGSTKGVRSVAGHLTAHKASERAPLLLRKLSDGLWLLGLARSGASAQLPAVGSPGACGNCKGREPPRRGSEVSPQLCGCVNQKMSTDPSGGLLLGEGLRCWASVTTCRNGQLPAQRWQPYTPHLCLNRVGCGGLGKGAEGDILRRTKKPLSGLTGLTDYL